MSDEEAEIWGLRKLCNLEKWIWAGNYKQFQQCLVLARLTSIKKELLGWGNKGWLYSEKTSEATNRYDSLLSFVLFFCLCSVCVCVFSITKKYPGAPGNHRQQ